MHPRPRLKLNSTATGFLDSLLHSISTQAEPSTNILVICSRKAAFTTQLCSEASQLLKHSKSLSFLHPTISLLTTTSRIRILYLPTLAHFRAYISTLPLLRSSPTFIPGGQLFIWDLFSLHTHSELTGEQVEFSVQGVSDTCACLAEAGWGAGMRVEVAAREGEELLGCEVEVFNSGMRGVGGMRGRMVPLRGCVERCFEVEMLEKQVFGKQVEEILSIRLPSRLEGEEVLHEQMDVYKSEEYTHQDEEAETYHPADYTGDDEEQLILTQYEVREEGETAEKMEDLEDEEYVHSEEVTDVYKDEQQPDYQDGIFGEEEPIYHEEEKKEDLKSEDGLLVPEEAQINCQEKDAQHDDEGLMSHEHNIQLEEEALREDMESVKSEEATVPKSTKQGHNLQLLDVQDSNQVHRQGREELHEKEIPDSQESLSDD